MGLFWELFQQDRIRRADETASEARTETRGAMREIEDLRQRVRSLEERAERLTLAAIAMAEILRDRDLLSEEEVEAKIREIDLRDGELDGKLATRVQRCSKCDRVISRSRRACLYCGTPLTEGSVLFPS
jgi:hypothetical protein